MAEFREGEWFLKIYNVKILINSMREIDHAEYLLWVAVESLYTRVLPNNKSVSTFYNSPALRSDGGKIDVLERRLLNIYY